MSPPADRGRDDLPPGISARDAELLALTAQALEDSRPLPRPEFRGELRRRLMQGPGRLSLTGRRRTRWQPLAASYAVLGVALLAVAAIGVAGGGPFGA